MSNQDYYNIEDLDLNVQSFTLIKRNEADNQHYYNIEDLEQKIRLWETNILELEYYEEDPEPYRRAIKEAQEELEQLLKTPIYYTSESEKDE